jgi:hypothetical protein
MDVKQYYRKIAETEAGVKDNFTIVVSVETSDGGRAGVLSEVSRHTAARLIVEGRALVASVQQKQQYFEQQTAIRKAAAKAELARRVQVAIIADPDLKAPAANISAAEPNPVNQ